MRIFLSVCIILSWIQSGLCQSKKLPPKNETGQDPTLAAFVADLQKALPNKDVKWIMTSLDDDVRGSFGDENGKTAFKKEWDLDADSTMFWQEMTRVIEMGGVFLHDEADETGKYQFVFPYTYAADLNIEDDYYNLGIITGKNVNLRSEPNTNSKVQAQLTYDIVTFNVDDESGIQTTSGMNEYGQPDWYKIETYDKSKSGWVNWKYVYSLMGPRLFLYKNAKGEWKISAFLTGD